MFEKATREKYRFMTSKGAISTEQLWDVPLRSRDGFNLDEVAKHLAKQVREAGEESFVEVQSTGNKLALAQLELVKYVISTKLAEEDQRDRQAKTAQQRARLLEVLEKKQDAAIEALSVEEIKAQIAQLQG